jgi:hypothetical protein
MLQGMGDMRNTPHRFPDLLRGIPGLHVSLGVWSEAVES